MRYIKKGREPEFFNEYRKLRLSVGQTADYDSFDKKSELNDILRAEQRGICCYCMQHIDHYNLHNEGGSHNEHLVPQKGSSGNPDLELSYTNLYACCNYSKGKPYLDTHCGEHKKDDLIENFIQRTDCRDYFKYNVIGEILPNGNYETFSDYQTYFDILPLSQQHAFSTIQILNLNHSILVNKRKNTIKDFFKLAISNSLTKEQAENKIQRITNSQKLPPFVESLIFYYRKVKPTD